MGTIREQIIALLSQEQLNAIDISQMVSIREREVYEHLEHISHSLARKGKKLVFNPYECLGCGYVFKKRKRFDRPGRCPSCKGGHISMATYYIL